MKKRAARTVFIVSFLAPAVLIYGLFVAYPVLQSLVLACYRWRGVSAQRKFVGLENFKKLAQDDVFWRAMSNNLWLLVAAAIVMTVLAVGLAHAMQTSGRVARVLRSVYLFPQVISLVVVAILWMFLYNPSFGLIAGLLKVVGLGAWARPWLGDPQWALPAVGIVFLWHGLGFFTMLYSAGLQSIPAEVTEAAGLDGAVGFQRFWRITWPLLWSVKRISAVYIVINVMNVFALVYLMTQGGPDRRTEVMLTYLYEQAFQNSQFGYATALAVANFALAMLLSLGLMFAFRRNPEDAK